jgi:5-methylcytosine-specific restriction endonuclease McrA
MRKYRNYTDDDIITHSKEVYSIGQLLRKLDLKPCGGNYANIKNNLQRLQIDTSHWKGQGWNKDQQLKDWSMYSKVSHLKKHLIKEKTHQCEKCLLTTWLEKPIVLEVHHKDGNRTNNNLDNLQLLCCNCHSITDNWRNKKRTK